MPEGSPHFSRSSKILRKQQKILVESRNYSGFPQIDRPQIVRFVKFFKYSTGCPLVKNFCEKTVIFNNFIFKIVKNRSFNLNFCTVQLLLAQLQNLDNKKRVYSLVKAVFSKKQLTKMISKYKI